MSLQELRKYVRQIIREESGMANTKPDNMAHQELAKAIVNGIESAHTQEKADSVIGADNVDVQELESSIRNSGYFSIGEAEYQWDNVWQQVSDILQKDYQQKNTLAFQLIDKLKNAPTLGTPHHTQIQT
jgi:hypothetical protein